MKAGETVEGALKPSDAKCLEGLEKEQLIGMPLLEAAKGQAELSADSAGKMLQALAGAEAQDIKKEP